jgi:hypothetical protein
MKTPLRIFAVLLTAGALLGFNANGQTWITNGLVAYFPFNGNPNDAAGTNNGTVYNATLTTNRFGTPNSAYYFNASTAYIDLGRPSNLMFQSNFTLSAWCLFQGGSLQNPRIISYCWGNGYELHTGGNGTNRKFQFTSGAATYNSTTTYPQGVWRQVVVTFTNSIESIYVNGVLDGTNATLAPVAFTNNLHLGNNSGTTSWDWWGGCIDDVRFYNRPLSAIEIAQLYSIETNPTPSTAICIYSNYPVVVFPTQNGVFRSILMATNLNSPVWITVTNGVPFSGIQISNPPPNAFFKLQ